MVARDPAWDCITRTVTAATPPPPCLVTQLDTCGHREMATCPRGAHRSGPDRVDDGNGAGPSHDGAWSTTGRRLLLEGRASWPSEN